MNNSGMMFGIALVLISLFFDCISNDPNESDDAYHEIKQFVSLCYITSCLVTIMSIIQ